MSFVIRILGLESYNRLDMWLAGLPGWHWSMVLAGRHPAWYQIGAMSVGAGFAVLLQVLRTRWVGFPLHPFAFAVAQSASLLPFWLSFLAAWLAKILIFRYGGLSLYRRTIPLALGLIVGDMAIGFLLTALGLL